MVTSNKSKPKKSAPASTGAGARGHGNGDDYTPDRDRGKGRRHWSGNYDEHDEREYSGKGEARRRAEYLAQRGVGHADDWPDFLDEANADLKEEDVQAKLKREGWKLIEAYNYNNTEGDLLYIVRRYHYSKFESKKLFLPYHHEGQELVRGVGPVRVPYELQELIEQVDQEINLVEGEKGVLALAAKGILATCVQGQIWSDDVAQFFAGRIVNVAMDNDDAGRDHTAAALRWLAKVNAIVRVPVLPDLKPRDGLDDWLTEHSVEDYLQIVKQTPVAGRINVTPHSFPAEEGIPRYDWLLGDHLLRGEVSGTAASGGTGKSNLSIIEALQMTSGKVLLYGSSMRPYGIPPLRVMLINLEDNRDTMDKRIAAIMRHYGLSPKDIGERLIVLAKGEIQIKVAKQLRSGDVERNEEIIETLTSLMIEQKADVLSIDSFIRTHSVHENDNSAIEKVVECFETIAQPANCAVHLWHHTRKMNGEQATVESARGAQAFIDACRSVRMLQTMTRKERDELIGSNPDIGEPGWYFRAWNGKRNFAPPADESVWYKYVNITLNNQSKLEHHDGDKIGVVTTWEYPKIELPKINQFTVPGILAAVKSGGPWRADQRSTKEPWVGVAIAKALGHDLLNKQVKKAVAKVVQELLAAGKLRVVIRADQHRDPRQYVEVAADKGTTAEKED